MNDNKPTHSLPPEFSQDYTSKLQPIYDQMYKEIKFLSEKYNISEMKMTRVVIASLTSTSLRAYEEEAPILGFLIQGVFDSIVEWSSIMRQTKGGDYFPPAPIGEGSTLEDLDPKTEFNYLADINSIGPALARLIHICTDELANRFNICGHETFMDFLGNTVSGQLMAVSSSRENYELHVQAFAQGLLQARRAVEEQSKPTHIN